MDAIGIARSGLDASMMRLTASASNIANAPATGVDVTQELVEHLAVRLAFEANLKVVATAGALHKSTLQLWG